MALVNVCNIEVLDNPSSFTNPLMFQVTFECLSELKDDLEWRVVYVGSAENDQHDQELENVFVGPVPVGTNKFVLQTQPPDPSKIPASDLLGVTVVLVTCSYKGQEFIRVGYYVNNEYTGELNEDGEPPAPENIDPAQIQRNLLADKPRVTRFNINWKD
eukprot:gb/GECG01015974.1/.p1 GENE.gb/GECG01015974.1/~~gb/GECG01015974.1/.p1  ORF type:complete len:159 (+),score=17.23 gb/GECG01015974.1/:1-477(+)